MPENPPVDPTVRENGCHYHRMPCRGHWSLGLVGEGSIVIYAEGVTSDTVSVLHVLDGGKRAPTATITTLERSHHIAHQIVIV